MRKLLMIAVLLLAGCGSTTSFLSNVVNRLADGVTADEEKHRVTSFYCGNGVRELLAYSLVDQSSAAATGSFAGVEFDVATLLQGQTLEQACAPNVARTLQIMAGNDGLIERARRLQPGNRVRATGRLIPAGATDHLVVDELVILED